MPMPMKPLEIKELEGNPGQRRLPKNPVRPRGKPRRPSDLSPEARREWDRVVPVLNKLHLLSSVDRAALVIYCEQWSTYVQATRELRETGLMVPGRFPDTYVRNPLAAIARDAAVICRAMCQEFGMTPSARGRMTLPDAKSDDLADLLGED